MGASQVVSKTPPVIAFNAAETGFAVPAAEDCGPLRPLLNRRLGLPAAAENSVSYSAYYSYRTYDDLE